MSDDLQLLAKLQSYRPAGARYSWHPAGSDDPKLQGLWNQFVGAREKRVKEALLKAKSDDGKVDALELGDDLYPLFKDPFSGNRTLQVAKEEFIQLYATDGYSKADQSRRMLENQLFHLGMAEEAKPSQTAVREELAQFTQMTPTQKARYLNNQWTRYFGKCNEYGRQRTQHRTALGAMGMKAIKHRSRLAAIKQALTEKLEGTEGKLSFDYETYSRNGRVFAYEVRAQRTRPDHLVGLMFPFLGGFFFPPKTGRYVSAFVDPETFKVVAEK